MRQAPLIKFEVNSLIVGDPAAFICPFEHSDPRLARIGRELLYQNSTTASAFLATVAPDIEALFRCSLSNVLHTHWDNWGSADASPTFTKWHS